MYDPNTIEQGMKLKDGRRIYKTHNGFRAFVMSEEGDVTPVTQDYYNTVKHLKAGPWK